MERRLEALRKIMRERSSLQGPEIEAYIVTSFDEHQNHQEDDASGRLQYISGFSGPIGDAVVSKTLNKSSYLVYKRMCHTHTSEMINFPKQSENNRKRRRNVSGNFTSTAMIFIKRTEMFLIAHSHALNCLFIDNTKISCFMDTIKIFRTC